MTRLISGIYSHGHADPPSEAEAKERKRDACKEAWHKHGLAVIDPNDINDDWDRQHIINQANKLYGSRNIG